CSPTSSDRTQKNSNCYLYSLLRVPTGIVGLSGGLDFIAKRTPAPPTHRQKPLLLLAALVSAPTTTKNAHAAPPTSGSAIADICDDCAAPPFIWRTAQPKNPALPLLHLEARRRTTAALPYI
ncbi:unnamed protein product, partial [Ectocarpus sp. 12 AP-2014]